VFLRDWLLTRVWDWTACPALTYSGISLTQRRSCTVTMINTSYHYNSVPFSGIEDIQVRAAVAKGEVESVEESMVSVVEAHTPSSRGIIHQNGLEDETIVS
jgi:hypothetical protein